MTRATDQLWQYGVRGAHWLNEFTRGRLGMVAAAAREVLNPRTSITAAAIAYFSLLSLFPLILVSISVASFSLGPLADRQHSIQELEFVAPALGQLLGRNLDEIIQARGPVSSVALVGLIWAASAVFNTFGQALNEIWGLKRRRGVWKRRGLAILFVLALVGPALFAASLASSMISTLRTWWPDQINPIVGGISWAGASFFDVALFMVVYSMLPHGDATWREILPGAIGAGLLWEIAKKAFLVFVTTYVSVSNLVYGSVAVIIAFLAWAYVSALIFLFGAHVILSSVQLRSKQ